MLAEIEALLVSGGYSLKYVLECNGEIFVFLINETELKSDVTSSSKDRNNHCITKSIRMEYPYIARAHFLPLTNNSKLHQVKVIVDYSVRPSSATTTNLINPNHNAIMKVFAINETLVKTSSFPKGLKISPTGQAQLATTIPDNSIRNATVFVMFTDASKIANFSNPLNVTLNLVQNIPPS